MITRYVAVVAALMTVLGAALPAQSDAPVRATSLHEVARSVRTSVVRAIAQRENSGDPCADRSHDDDRPQHCEVRDLQMPAGAVRVDAGRNGGIRVEGDERSDVVVRAIVRASARSDARAQEIAAAVRVTAANGQVSASGPETSGREWWAVSYRLTVPRQIDLDLTARNGGITILGVRGNLRFDTVNGGLRLADLGGRVRGETRNGGLDVSLAGSSWEGDLLDVETTNGGVKLAIPEHYNAELETGTTNGRFQTEYPLTVRGRISGGAVKATLGSGGAPIRVVTTNGGLRIGTRD